MTYDIREAQVQVAIVLGGEEVAAEIRDRRPEAVAVFAGMDETQREHLATDAWTIGLRALQNVHTAAQECRLEEIGATLRADIDRQLGAHVEEQHKIVSTVLERYFDPSDGQVSQRLAAFADDEGALARLLERYLGPHQSVLSESLARQVGETSPLFKKLSPTESEGLVKVLEAQLRAVLDESRAATTRALDPLAEDGSVARFLRALREELASADQDRQTQLASAVAALDANDENSLISRLVREQERARKDFLEAVNPDASTSPMALVKGSLTKLLQEHGNAQADVARRQEERQAIFEKEMREALARMETRRTHDQKAPRGGLDFEDAVTSFVRVATQAAPCVFDVTGACAGIGRCKKGDAVLRFTDESAFSGAGVVFEAKQDASYTVQRALDELDAARKNRDAVAGVFVMARSHAGDAFPRFARYGKNVLVTWDDQDAGSDPYLHAAISLGMALVARTRTTGDPGDIAALRDIESRIEAELSRLDRMEKHADAIRKNVDGIGEEIRKSQKALGVLTRKAQSTLRSLNVESSDEAAELESPIALPVESMAEAVRALQDGARSRVTERQLLPE
jgi:hypothetical protein